MPVSVQSCAFYPSLPPKGESGLGSAGGSQKLMRGLPPPQPGAAPGPACSQLPALPGRGSHLPGREAGRAAAAEPRAPEAGVPGRKSREQPGTRTTGLRLCSPLRRGSVPPSQMNGLINGSPAVRSVELSRWKPWLFFFFFPAKRTVGTPVTKGGHGICCASGVSYPNHPTEPEPFSQGGS